MKTWCIDTMKCYSNIEENKTMNFVEKNWWSYNIYLWSNADKEQQMSHVFFSLRFQLFRCKYYSLITEEISKVKRENCQVGFWVKRGY